MVRGLSLGAVWSLQATLQICSLEGHQRSNYFVRWFAKKLHFACDIADGNLTVNRCINTKMPFVNYTL